MTETEEYEATGRNLQESIEVSTLPELHRRLSYYIDQATYNDHLEIIAITSQAGGMTEGEGFSSGEGKSTCALGYSKGIYLNQVLEEYSAKNLDQEIDEATAEVEAEELVKVNIGYSRLAIYECLERGLIKRVRAFISDDAQLYAGKHYSHDPDLRALSHLIEPARPILGCYFITCPHIGSLATCFRDLIQFEVKIPYRGLSEVQRIKRVTKYDDPLNPKAKLDYFHHTRFDTLSPTMDAWYKAWRATNYAQHIRGQKLAYMKKQGMIVEARPQPEGPRTDMSEAARAMAKKRWAPKNVEDTIIEIK